MTVLVVAGGLPAAATLLGLWGALDWRLDLLSHFRVQYLLVLLVVVALSALLRRFRVAAVFAVPLLLNATLIAPLYVAPAARLDLPRWRDLPPQDDPPLISPVEFEKPRETADTLRVLVFNIHAHSRRWEDVGEYIRESSADVIVLLEVTPQWVEQAAYRLAPFRARLTEARTDAFGLAVLDRSFSRRDVLVESARVIELADGPLSVPAAEVAMKWNGRPIVLLGVHTLPPVRDSYAQQRDRMLRGVAEWAQRQSTPVVVVGDLNASPWSAHFGPMLEVGGLVNSQRGFGLQPTWPASRGPLGKIPIDHCLHSPELATIDRYLGPSLGSDHHPLNVELARR